MKKPIYTMVHEGYDVDVYRTQKGALSAAAELELCLENASFSEVEQRPATLHEISKLLKAAGEVKLYPLDGGDWKYKLTKLKYGFSDRNERVGHGKNN